MILELLFVQGRLSWSLACEIGHVNDAGLEASSSNAGRHWAKFTVAFAAVRWELQSWSAIEHETSLWNPSSHLPENLIYQGSSLRIWRAERAPNPCEKPVEPCIEAHGSYPCSALTSLPREVLCQPGDYLVILTEPTHICMGVAFGSVTFGILKDLFRRKQIVLQCI